MEERRKAGRSPSYLGGQITTDRKLIAMDCVVRNTSDAGARLVVPTAALLPDVFELHIPRKNTAYRVCARWRDADGIGVQVMPLAPDDAPVPIELARRIKQLEAENADLRRRLNGTD